MVDTSWRFFLGGVAVSFALGFGLAWQMRTPAPEAPATVALAPPPPAPLAATVAAPVPLPTAASLNQDASADALWALALLPQGGYEAEDRLRRLAQSNPLVVRSLLGRYSSMQPAPSRELLKSILSTVQTPEVIAFASHLAASSNTADRQFGFALLQSVAPNAAETRSLARRSLASEQSPAVLVQALDALQASAAEPEESALVVAQLKTLAQHADPSVRSRSLAQLGQWDKKGDSADSLVQALHDSAPDVRQAAIFAIAQAGVRTDGTRAALMGLAANTGESKDVRGSALQALERFSLSKDEYASFAQARRQVLGM
jgi:hypothetical protein